MKQVGQIPTKGHSPGDEKMKQLNTKTVLAVAISTLMFAALGCNSPLSENSPEFRQTVARIGFGDAVVLYEDRMTDGFWGGLDFHQWIEIYKAAPQHSTLERKASLGAVDKTTNVEETIALYMVAPASTEFELAAENKMLTQASTIHEWLIIYAITKSGSRSENIALQGIRNTAQSFTKWLFVYKVSGSGSELETEAIRRMSDLASNTEEWAIVFVVSPSGSETEKKAKEKLGRDMLEAPPAPPDKAEDRPKKKV